MKSSKPHGIDSRAIFVPQSHLLSNMEMSLQFRLQWTGE